MKKWIPAIAMAAAFTLGGTAALAQDNGSRTAVNPEGQALGKPEFNPRGAAILTEDFDDITTLPGAGWVQTNNSTPIGTTGWFQGNDAVFPSQAGAPTAYIGANFNNTAGTEIDNWLITPVLPLNTVSELSFWNRSPDGSTFPDRIQVWMNVTNTGSNTADFTVMVADVNPTSTAGWQQIVVNAFPGAPAQGRLAFRYLVSDAGPTGNNSDYIGIDSVEVLGGGVPSLSLGMVTEMDVCAAIPANNNAIIEPGEVVNFSIPVNASGGAFTNVMGTLSSGSAGVNVVTAMASYGNIADAGSASANFSIRLDETVACGSSVDLTLALTSGEGNFSFPISRPVGSSATFVYSGLPLPITDNTPAGVNSTATVGGVPGNITAVSVNVSTTHTWVGDLIYTITSPMGTTVTLLDRPNVPLGTFGCSNNDVNVTFTDGQPDPEAICSGAPPQGNTADPWPVSMAGPVNPLSAFNGEDANGVWTLTVSDNGGGDTGTLNNWELIITPAPTGTCNVCPSNADVSLTKTSDAVAPLMIGDGFNYTLTASNAGPGDGTNAVVTDTLPANVTYVSNTCGATFAAPTLTWTIGTLANGASVNCSIAVTVNAVGAIVNTANIATSTNDPNPANNAGTSTLGGAMLADLSIGITSDAPNNLGVGQQYTYTVTGTNAGPSDATGVLFNLLLSSKVSFVSSSCGAAAAGNSVSWSVPTLLVGATTTCDITVAVVAPGDIIVDASVNSATPDPNLVNNSTQIVVGFLTVQVPTLGHMGLLLIALLLAGFGVVVIRRS